MKPMVMGTPSVGVTAEGVTHLNGVARCGSDSCPVCRPVKGERRAKIYDQVLGAAIARGEQVFFVTATAAHNARTPLSGSYDLVRQSYSAAFSGRASQHEGYIGQIRVFEFTYGLNGWHPHIHAAIIWKGDYEAGVRFLRATGTRYRQAIRARGGRVSHGRVGWDVAACRSTADVSSYLVKVDGGWGVGLELARGDIKKSRARKGAMPFELLAAAAAGDTRARALWHEFEISTRGRQLMLMSPGLAARYQVEDLTDEEAATEELSGDLSAVFIVAPRRWLWMLRSGQVAAFLEAAAALVLTGEAPPRWWWGCLAEARQLAPPGLRAA